MARSPIIWINGPFGAGKTTLVTELAARWPQATVFDPEHLGYLLRAWQPPDVEVEDFQHLSVWRVLARETAAGLVRDFGRPLLVPMTLLRPTYFDEIVGGLRAAGVPVHHFCLVTDKRTVVARAAERGDTGDWFPTKYDEYASSLQDRRFATFLDAGALGPPELADAVVAAVGPLD